jgi:hypothetical protein
MSLNKEEVIRKINNNQIFEVILDFIKECSEKDLDLIRDALDMELLDKDIRDTENYFAADNLYDEQKLPLLQEIFKDCSFEQIQYFVDYARKNKKG